MAYTVHWILHIRILEGVDFPFLRRSSQSRYPTLREDSLPPEPQEKSKDTGVSSLSFLQQIFQPRNPTGFSWIAGRFFTNWAIREVPWKESYNRSRQHIKKQRHHFPENLHIVKLCFSSSHVWMWELDHKEGWVPKNRYSQTVLLEETLESLGLQGDQASQSQSNSILNMHENNSCWIWSSNSLAIWCKEPTHWESLWCWERLKANRGGGRGWHG